MLLRRGPSFLRWKTRKGEMGLFSFKKVPFSLQRGLDSFGAAAMEQPHISNPFQEDPLLKSYLGSHLPAQVFGEVSLDLDRFGARITKEIDFLGRECELHPPRLLHYDPWGQRKDHLLTCTAWKRLKEVAAEEGLVAEAYERRYAQWSRLAQMAKLFLFAASSGLFSCPLAMTDGAAKVIESLGIPQPLEDAFCRLTSRDPRMFWTSGQWMTERKGGSDVAGGTETIAREQSDGTYSLHGFKWFTSAPDSDMALTLARVMTPDGDIKEGLSLFYLQLLNGEGRWNGFEIRRLKDKLGTRQLPTAEIILDGAKALRISPEGRGIPSIAAMLTMTRIHNAVSSVAVMRRVTHLARDYATKREAFGKTLNDHPLHVRTLAWMEVQSRGAFLLLMETARLLGLEEAKMADMTERHLFRLLTPVLKLYTAKQAVAVASEGLECFGGQGFMEDTGLAGILRDAQVLPIWEGTTNILSLDVLRSIHKSHGNAMQAFFSSAQAKMASARDSPDLKPSVQMVQKSLQKLQKFSEELGLKEASGAQMAARDFAYSLALIYGGVLLLEHGARPEASSADITAAQRWCLQDLCPVSREEEAGAYKMAAATMDTALVFEGHPLHRGTQNGDLNSFKREELC
nr:acyl-CoA dehydrogenase family member 11-like [Anolis sagrei ordinatus]XP_060630589.1 acyl-CoA dehydrogenase family member 11-like [Anolis sagrei ordinatus]XP_060630590.1 acyl-CoA dehydrogenase family member 11-like [Anolis sagrei ordinatus]XP_060630591.1 acyl-CoA dehydrogenase family member 11-like [Anolis sagrei ordinatus]